MRHLASVGRLRQHSRAEAHYARCFVEVQDIVQTKGRRVDTPVAGKFERHALLIDPDIAAVFPGEIRALVQVIAAAALLAPRFGGGSERLKADEAGQGICHPQMVLPPSRPGIPAPPAVVCAIDARSRPSI